MKKNKLVFLLFILFGCKLSAQYDLVMMIREPWEEYTLDSTYLQNKVKCIRIECENSGSLSFWEERWKITEVYFDSTGKLSKEILFTQNSIVESWYFYFDQHKKIDSISTISFTKKEDPQRALAPIEEKEFYSAPGVKEKGLFVKGSNKSVRIKYDDRGNAIQTTTIKEWGALLDSTVHRKMYDTKNRLIFFSKREFIITRNESHNGEFSHTRDTLNPTKIFIEEITVQRNDESATCEVRELSRNLWPYTLSDIERTKITSDVKFKINIDSVYEFKRNPSNIPQDDFPIGYHPQTLEKHFGRWYEAKEMREDSFKIVLDEKGREIRKTPMNPKLTKYFAVQIFDMPNSFYEKNMYSELIGRVYAYGSFLDTVLYRSSEDLNAIGVWKYARSKINPRSIYWFDERGFLVAQYSNGADYYIRALDERGLVTEIKMYSFNEQGENNIETGKDWEFTSKPPVMTVVPKEVRKRTYEFW